MTIKCEECGCEVQEASTEDDQEDDAICVDCQEGYDNDMGGDFALDDGHCFDGV